MQQNFRNEIQKLNTPLFYWIAWGGGTLLILLSAWLWWSYIYLSPKNVFWGMMENNLATKGFYKRVDQTSEQGGLTQEIQVSLGQDTFAESRVTLTQKSGETEGTIVTETIGTENADYVRYESVNVAGQPNNAFTEVVGQWGKTEYGERQNGSVQGRLLSEALLNTIPVGAVSSQARENLLRTMQERNVYKVDYGSVKKTDFNGKAVYEYTVEVDPEAYVNVLQEFSKAVGLGEVQGLSASDYAGAPPSTIKVAVYPKSRQLAKVSYSEERTEVYGGYGITKQLELPENTIPAEELQKKIELLQ